MNVNIIEKKEQAGIVLGDIFLSKTTQVVYMLIRVNAITEECAWVSLTDGKSKAYSFGSVKEQVDKVLEKEKDGKIVVYRQLEGYELQLLKKGEK